MFFVGNFEGVLMKNMSGFGILCWCLQFFDICKGLIIVVCSRLLCCCVFIEVGQFDIQNGSLNVIELGVDVYYVVVVVFYLFVIGNYLQLLFQCFIVGIQCIVIFVGVQVFRGVERGIVDMADSVCFLSMFVFESVVCVNGLSIVFNNLQFMCFSNFYDRFKVVVLFKKIDWDYGFGFWCDCCFYQISCNVKSVWVYVYYDWFQVEECNDFGCGYVGEGRYNYFIVWLQANFYECDLKCVCIIGVGDNMVGVQVRFYVCFKRFYSRAVDVGIGLQDFLNSSIDFWFQLFVLCFEVYYLYVYFDIRYIMKLFFLLVEI